MAARGGRSRSSASSGRVRRLTSPTFSTSVRLDRDVGKYRFRRHWKKSSSRGNSSLSSRLPRKRVSQLSVMKLFLRKFRYSSDACRWGWLSGSNCFCVTRGILPTRERETPSMFIVNKPHRYFSKRSTISTGSNGRGRVPVQDVVRRDCLFLQFSFTNHDDHHKRDKRISSHDWIAANKIRVCRFSGLLIEDSHPRK